MFDVVTFGSATRDIFLKAERFLISDFRADQIKKIIQLPYGLKVSVKEIHFHSGGGGTNTAATFTAQGLKTAYCGVIGRDPEGKAVLKEIKDKGIETKFVQFTSKKPTNTSVIFSTPQERTILVYKGASATLEKQQIPWGKIKGASWFYIASLDKQISGVFKNIINFAAAKKIKIMLNPGKSQLEINFNKLYPILKKADAILLNVEEARLLLGKTRMKSGNLAKKIGKMFGGTIIITDGSGKAYVFSDGNIYSAVPPKTEILDKTGAGDAFGSGFLASYINHKGDIEKAFQFAIGNSISCLKKWGAKEGLLAKGQSYKKVKIKKEK